MDLDDIVTKVESEFPDHGWLVRSDRRGSYFANVTSPDFDSSVVPYVGRIHTGRAATPAEALEVAFEKVWAGTPDPRVDNRTVES